MASLVVPANAVVSGIYLPKDNISKTVYEGNNATVYYEFNGRPFISVKEKESGNVTTGYYSLYVSEPAAPEVYIFRVYPLGVQFAPGQDISNGVIDVSDFKDKSIINLTCSIDFNAQYRYHSAADGDTSFYFDSSAYVCFYDIDGCFISQTTTGSVRENVLIQDQGSIADSGSVLMLDVGIPLEIPDDAVYMAPCVLTYFYPPDTHASHTLENLTASCKTFYMAADKNLLLEQSATLEAVENQLDDLNDKADTIINGTPEQNQDASNMMGLTQDKSEAAQDAMDREDALIEDFFDEDGNNLGLEQSKKTLFDLFNSQGWARLMELFEPIMSWPTTSVLMLMVVAVANLSIILFGR